jgi:hypothetical protein
MLILLAVLLSLLAGLPVLLVVLQTLLAVLPVMLGT